MSVKERILRKLDAITEDLAQMRKAITEYLRKQEGEIPAAVP